MEVTTRCLKSTAWRSEYSSIDSVRIFFRTFSIGLTSADDAHRVDTTSWFLLCSQRVKSLRCVVFPDPSGPSKAISRPREDSRSAISLRSRRGVGVGGIGPIRYHRGDPAPLSRAP